MSQFLKAKNQALQVEQKNLIKYPGGYFSPKSILKIKALNDYQDQKTDLRMVDVAAKAKLLKAQLIDQFPENTFSVKIERYSGGSSINAYWKGPKIDPQIIRELENTYSDGGKTDIQSDYFDYDNYCSIVEDSQQRQARFAKCPKCENCGSQEDRIAITSDDKVICNWCFNSGKFSSFKKLMHDVEVVA